MSAVLETITPSDVQALADQEKRDALSFVEANKVAVVDLGTLQQAVDTRAAIGKRKTSIVEKLAPPKSWAFKLHRWFCDLEAAALAPYDELDTYERQQITAYKAEQDRQRQARERELAEERRREDQARAAAEAAALESAGETAMAEATLAEAIAAPPSVVVLPDATKGIAKFRREWKWRYTTDEARALQLLPRAYLTVDTRKLNAYAKAMQSSASLPGVQVYYEDVPIR
jgi:hypothetical protein